METIKVYHAKKPNFGFGDEIEFNDVNFEFVAEVETTSKDEAFKLTNNIDQPWHLNKKVIARKQPCRSTSVGDVLVCSGIPYRCEDIGWSEIKQEEKPKYFICDDCGAKVNENDVTDDGCPNCTD